MDKEILFNCIQGLFQAPLFATIMIEAYFSISTIAKTKYNLKHIDKFKEKLISKEEIEKAKECELKREKISDKKNNKKREKVIEFYNEVKDKFSEEQQKLIEAKIDSLKISSRKIGLLMFLASATYNPTRNEINFLEKNAFSHEFIHLATSVYSDEDKISLCGFSQTKIGKGKDGYKIGSGLNEGYTNLFDCRNYDIDIKKAYYSQSLAILMLEKILRNPEKMEDFFKNISLPDLIDEFKKYDLEDAFYEVLILLDSSCNSFLLTEVIYGTKANKRIIDMFLLTNPTEAEKEDFLNTIKCKKSLLNYAHKNGFPKYIDDSKKEKGSFKKKIKHKKD